MLAAIFLRHIDGSITLSHRYGQFRHLGRAMRDILWERHVMGIPESNVMRFDLICATFTD